MPAQGFIKRIQEKPESERKRVAFIAALSITVVIFVIWVIGLGVRFSGSESETAEETPSPLGVLGRQLKNAGKDIAAGFSVIKNSFGGD